MKEPEYRVHIPVIRLQLAQAGRPGFFSREPYSEGSTIGDSFQYRVAGQVLVSDCRIGFLDGFECNEPVPVPSQAPEYPGSVAVGSKQSVTGWLAGRERELSCEACTGTYELDIAGIGRFSIDRDLGGVFCRAISKKVGRRTFEEALLGPPLAFALAVKDRWMMHAAAVKHREKIFLLSGASGAGKSTLSRWLDGQPGFEAVADDILLCGMEDSIVSAFPAFPQLKWGGQRHREAGASRAEVSAMFIVDPVDAKKPPGIRGGADESGSPGAFHAALAVKDLAEQSVCLKLFDRELKKRQLAFCAAFAETVPIYHLNYPHNYNKLKKVSEVISEVM